MSHYLQRLPRAGDPHLREAWKTFVTTGHLDDRVRPEIATSWRRCAASGLSPSSPTVATIVDEEAQAARLKRSRDLLEATDPALRTLFAAIRPSNGAGVLVDSEGYVLRIVAEGTMRLLLNAQNFSEGNLAAEAHIGTTGISLGLVTGEAQWVHAEEHYLRALHDMICAAAPIRRAGPIEGFVGIMVPVHPRLEQSHLLGVAVATAQTVEQALRLQDERRQVALAHDYLHGALESFPDAIVLLDGRGRLRDWNALARQLLGGVERERPLVEALSGRGMLDAGAAAAFRELITPGGERLETAINLNGRGRTYLTRARPIRQDGCEVGALVQFRPVREVASTISRFGGAAQYCFERMIGDSPELRGTIAVARRAAASEVTVLLTGETGTGKELFAHSIHAASPRSERPFIAVNCAALPHDLLESELFGYAPGAFTGAHRGGRVGKFELSDGGTIFLDEIAELSLSAQTKLLRVIESGEVCRLGDNRLIRLDLRIVAATNRNLAASVRNGDFREDLFHRVNVLALELPPLRARKGDVEQLASDFLAHLQERNGPPRREPLRWSDDALGVLRSHPWPGNVRELRNLVEKACHLVLGPQITAEDCRSLLLNSPRVLPDPAEPTPAEASPRNRELSRLERQALVSALDETRWNIAATARRLGVTRPTVYSMLRRHSISLPGVSRRAASASAPA